MPSAVSDCPDCGGPGRWGFDDDWRHKDSDDAEACSREGYYPADDDD
jgi:hypothetical protein